LSENNDKGSDSEPQVIKWFKQNYPSENYLASEIAKHVNEIFAQIGSGGKQLPLDLFALPTPEGKLTVGMRDVMIIFLGVMAKTIIDTISKNMQTQAELEPKLREHLEEQARKTITEYAKTKFPAILEMLNRCSKCDLENDWNAFYCKNCGNRLQN
jgi:hypothetical protein